MNDFVIELMVKVVMARLLYPDSDLVLLLAERDVKYLDIYEPHLMRHVKTYTGEDLYFLEMPIKLRGDRGSPTVVERLL